MQSKIISLKFMKTYYTSPPPSVGCNAPFMDVGVVSYLYRVSLVFCPSLLQICPAGSLFQVSE